MGFVGSYARNLVSLATGREPSRPLLFSYYVTHRCDLACRYCSDGGGRPFRKNPVGELPTADAKRLVSILRGAADTLDVTGGEPMQRPDLEEIMAHARELGLRVVLNTKGLGLEERPDLVSLADVLVLSVDALDPSPLAGLLGRPREVAERVLAALRFAVARCAETGTALVLSAVATPGNLDGVAEVLRFAAAHSLGFHVSPEIVGKTVNPALRGASRYVELMDEVLASKRAGGGVLGVEQYLRGVRDFSRFRCHPLLMPTIRPDGRLFYPCLESGRAEVSVLEAGSYRAALDEARRREGLVPDCRDRCHIFCHMALSLLQRHPLAALREPRIWRNGHA